MISDTENKPIVDAHCHIYPDKIAEKAAVSIGRFYDIQMDLDGKIDTLLSEGKKAGVTHYLVHSVATTPAQVASINRFIADTVAKYPDKMTGFGTLHPDSEDIAGDVEHLISLGLKGVKLHPDFQRFHLDGHRSMEIYRQCEGRLPLLIHTGDKRYDFSNPNRLKPILEAHPNLTVIGAHFGGWSMWQEASEELCEYPNLMVDCSSSLYAVSPEDAVKMIHLYGADRVLFGSDYPMWRPSDEVNRVNSLDLTDEEKDKIFYKNAYKLLGL